MANIESAKKRARQTLVRTQRNKARTSRVRNFIRKVEEAISSGSKTAAAEALKSAQPEMMRGASKGVFNKNTMSRKISRLNARIKALA